MIMNSWKSIGASACAPPLMMFIIGTGRTFAFGAAEVVKERLAQCLARGVGGGQGDAEDGVGAELRLGLRAVEFDHRAVDAGLVAGVDADQVRGGFRRSHS